MSLELPRIWWRPENAELATTIQFACADFGAPVPGIRYSGELTKVADVSMAFDATLNVNLEDVEAILAFVREYGPMQAHKHDLATGVVSVESVDRVTDSGLDGERKPDGSFFRASAIEGGEAISDFRAAAGAVRSLAALRTHLEDWVSIQALRGAWPKDSPWESPASKSEAADKYKWAIDEAFKYLTIEARPIGSAGSVDGVARLRWCLYARCVFELLGATHAPGRCARDDCGRWFTEQRDRRTKSTKRRSDAIYCSVRCGQIVAARTWRRRNHKPTGGR